VSSKAESPVAISFAEGALTTPIVRPTNVARTTLHMAAGAVCLALIRLLPGRGWLFAAAAAFAVAAWSMELGRRHSPVVNARLMRFFGPVAHAHERHHTNSSTWYVTALALLAAFAPLRAAELGVLVLGIADPAAGVVGRRFGRVRIGAGRTLEGTLAFVTVGGVFALAWLVLTGVAPTPALWLALIAAGTGAVAEVASSRRFDDNFAIPVSVAAVVGVVLGAFIER
jgi:dolichol kinase